MDIYDVAKRAVHKHSARLFDSRKKEDRQKDGTPIMTSVYNVMKRLLNDQALPDF